jgi:hydrogenase nickel incorporation protein HypB
MCGTCGCGRIEENGAHPGRAAAHAHSHGHSRGQEGEGEARRIAVERSLLEENDLRAEALRKRLAVRGIEAIGLLGSPGAGKTALLEATFARLGGRASQEAVVEGDCATDLDAQRVAAAGARVAQVQTGALCHLDAHLVEHALADLDLDGVSRLWIENVGNLVCPAPFSCGEARRALLISVPEGDDKPEKYPAMVAAADLLLITKADLLPHVDFDLERCTAAALRVRPGLEVLVVSARSGAGMDEWLRWVRGDAG